MQLNGKRILVTRAKHQAASFSNKLKALGAVAVELPLIEINPPDSWQEFDLAFKNIAGYDWIVFASVNAVEASLARAKELQCDLSIANIAAIGPVTVATLESYGVKTHFSPSTFVAESLVKEFPQYPNLSGQKILWPKTNIGRTYILDELRKAGAVVDIVACYNTSEPENKNELSKQLQNLLTKNQIDVITLASSQTVKNLSNLLDMLPDKKEILQNNLIAVIGPETKNSALKYLDKCDIEAKIYTMDGLIEAMAQYFSP